MSDKAKLTKEERLAKQKAKLLAQLAIVEQKEAGTYQIEREGVKALKFALRKRNKVLHAAQVLVNGRAATSKSPVLPTVASKIQNLRDRLTNMIEGADRANLFLENLPKDIELLEGLVVIAEGDTGEIPPMPTDLYRLETDNETDVEVEVRVTIESDDVESLKL